MTDKWTKVVLVVVLAGIALSTVSIILTYQRMKQQEQIQKAIDDLAKTLCPQKPDLIICGGNGAKSEVPPS